MPRKLLIIKLILPDQFLDAAAGLNVGNATKGTSPRGDLREGPASNALFRLTLELIPGFILLA
jgi:hypothetical protein